MGHVGVGWVKTQTQKIITERVGWGGVGGS